MATSRQLTPRRRRNLERKAEEKGFVLVQLYDQGAIADRLYHEPEWCRELLGQPVPHQLFRWCQCQLVLSLGNIWWEDRRTLNG